MKILSFNVSHNASACVLENGEILLYLEEERLSRRKRDPSHKFLISKIKKKFDSFDFFVTVTLVNDKRYYDFCGYVAEYFNAKWINYGDKHHLCHAANAFYASGYDEATCIVMDGQGSVVPLVDDGPVDLSSNNWIAETESVFHFEYPAKIKSINLKKRTANTAQSLGALVQGVSGHCGWEPLDGGKVMGLAPYGTPSVKLISKEWETDTSILNPDMSFNAPHCSNEDLCSSVQDVVEKWTASKIKAYGSKNTCLSGGIFLNCVANRKNLDIVENLYVDPICYDGGLAIGAAKLFYHASTGDTTKRPLTTLYLGPKYKVKNYGIKTSYQDVAKLLQNGNTVSVFQGRCEAGPRALGNRSILYTPCDKDGRDKINLVKNREKFRPFAAIILEQYAHEWFDLGKLQKSPFMMYACKAKDDLKHKIPSVLHIDDTCRIQTVSKDDNNHIYELLMAFYGLTGIPLLLNTSFNLAGQPLVETQEDALRTFLNSSLDYLYFPEISKIFSKT